MTVSQQTPVSNCWGNNSATEFSFDFYIAKESELLVEHTDLNGIKSTLENGVDYSIHEVGNKDGSYITFPLLGSKYKTLAWNTSTDQKELLTISLTLPIKQSAEYEDSGDLSKKNLELSFDYAIRLIQILNRKISRAVKVNEGDSVTPDMLIESLNESKRIATNAASVATSNAELAQSYANTAQEKAEVATAKTAEVTETYNNAMADIQKDWQDAVNDIEEKHSTAISEMTALKDSSMSAVKTAQTTAETSIKSLQSLAETSVNNGIANIETSKNNAISDISTAGAEQVANIQQTGFFMQDNKLYYITSEGETKELKSVSGYNLFDLKYSDHILEGNEAKGFALLGSYAYKTAVAGSRYGYPDFYNKCVAEKVAGTETTITVGDYSFTGFKNANGHIFFDIADKGTVDNIYTSTGKAWYYGIDTANERIFLPRVKNALVGMTDIADTSAVVPNTTNPMPQFTVHNDLGAVGNLHTFSVGGSPYNQVHWNGRQGNNNGNLLWTTKGNTGLLGDNANVKSALNNDNFYIYMCVGNTEQESAVTDVIDITTSENDTLPLGWSAYQTGVTPSSAFLASLGQQNSGTFYPKFYNEFSAKIGQAFGAGFIKAHTASDITDYDLVINQDEQTFRLPLKNGKENLVDYTKPTTFALGTNFTVPSNGVIYACANAYGGSKTWYWTINGGEKHYFGENSSGLVPVTVKVKKGDVFYITGNSADENNSYFYPFIGNGTLYYKVSNAVQNLQLLDVAEMTTALANKVDSTNTQWAVNACMPDYTAGVSVTVYSVYTALYDGCVFIEGKSGWGGNSLNFELYNPAGVKVNTWKLVGAENTQTYGYGTFQCLIPKGWSFNVAKGGDITITFYKLGGTEV